LLGDFDLTIRKNTSRKEAEQNRKSLKRSH
jgi:hypothetical protein